MAKSSKTAPPNSEVKSGKDVKPKALSSATGKEHRVPPKNDNTKGEAADVKVLPAKN